MNPANHGSIANKRKTFECIQKPFYEVSQKTHHLMQRHLLGLLLMHIYQMRLQSTLSPVSEGLCYSIRLNLPLERWCDWGQRHSFLTLESKVDNLVLNPLQSLFYSQISSAMVLNFFASSFPFFLLLIKNDTVSQTSLLPTEPRRISTSAPSKPFVIPLEHFKAFRTRTYYNSFLLIRSWLFGYIQTWYAAFY